MLIKCVLLVIGLIVMMISEYITSWGALGIVLAPLMARDIVAIKACQDGVKETDSYKDLTAIKWMSDPEIIQLANRVIDDCNSKIILPSEETGDGKNENGPDTESEPDFDPDNGLNDRETSMVDENMENLYSSQEEIVRNTPKRFVWKSWLGPIVAGTVLVGLIIFCIYCAVAGIERPPEPINLEDTNSRIFRGIKYPVPCCFQDPYSTGNTLSLYAERGKRLVLLFFASTEIPDNNVPGDENDIMDSVFHRFFENGAGAGNQSEEMECIQNALSTTLAGMPAKTYQYKDYIEGQDMIVTQTISCDWAKQRIHIISLFFCLTILLGLTATFSRALSDLVVCMSINREANDMISGKHFNKYTEKEIIERANKALRNNLEMKEEAHENANELIDS